MKAEPATPRIIEEEQDDQTRFDILAALTDGNPYVLLIASRKGNGGLHLGVDAGGSVESREDIVVFLEMALRHLRED